MSIYLDTSAVYDHLNGDSRQKAQVQGVIGDGAGALRSSFVRMEYLRSRIRSLINLYYSIKYDDSVSDGLKSFRQSSGFKPREVSNAFDSIEEWLLDHEDWKDKTKTLRRLGEAIVRMVNDVDESYARMPGDGIACQLGRLELKKEPFSEDLLLDFAAAFDRIFRGTPTCQICQFKNERQGWLRHEGIDVYSDKQIAKYKSFKGYLVQARNLQKLAASSANEAKCAICMKVGDSVIALQARKGMTILTSDSSFVVFGKILRRHVHKLKSGAALRKEAQDAGLASANRLGVQTSSPTSKPPPATGGQGRRRTRPRKRRR